MSKKLAPSIVDLECVGVDDNLASHLRELAEADDVRRKPRNEVRPSQGMMLPILAGEDEGPASLDLHHRSIPEADGPMDLVVELEEGCARTGHVVRGPTVKYPSVGILILARA